MEAVTKLAERLIAAVIFLSVNDVSQVSTCFHVRLLPENVRNTSRLLTDHYQMAQLIDL